MNTNHRANQNTYHISIQYNYTGTELALWQQDILLDEYRQNSIKASRDLILFIDQLLKKHTLVLGDLSFLSVNQGPGPFTTLRVLMATLQGITLAYKIPVLGVDGLRTSMQEFHQDQYPVNIMLLNAFAQDVYFGITAQQLPAELGETGYCHINRLLEQLKLTYPHQKIRFIGAGTELYKSEIQAAFGDNAIIAEQLPQFCSIQTVGRAAYAQWAAGDRGLSSIMPLYLKDLCYTQSLPNKQ